LVTGLYKIISALVTIEAVFYIAREKEKTYACETTRVCYKAASNKFVLHFTFFLTSHSVLTITVAELWRYVGVVGLEQLKQLRVKRTVK